MSEDEGARISEHDVASRLAGEKDEKWATILSKVARRDEKEGRKIRDRFWTLSKVGGKKARTTLAVGRSKGMHFRMKLCFLRRYGLCRVGKSLNKRRMMTHSMHGWEGRELEQQ